MKVTTVPIEKVSLLEGNPRQHPPRQIEALRQSYEKFGQYRPLVVDEKGEILAGNGLYIAMKESGATKVSVHTVTGLTPTQRNQLILADNRTGDLSLDNYEAVEALLREMDDYEVPGYDPEALRELVADAEEIITSAEEYGVLDEDTKERLSSRQEDLTQARENATVGTAPAPREGAAKPCPTCGRPW